MRYLLTLLITLFLSITAVAQYNWCVSIGENTKLRHVREDREKNVIGVSDAELITPGYFCIKFNRSDSAMRRSILVWDSSGAGLARWEEVKRSWRMRTTELKKMIEEKGELSFFYTEIPRDVSQAMLVKVRPVHLCTIKRSGN